VPETVTTGPNYWNSQAVKLPSASPHEPIHIPACLPRELAIQDGIVLGCGQSVRISDGAEGVVIGSCQHGSFCALTDQGGGTRPENQDGFLVAVDPQGYLTLKVADGLGGYGGGRLASHQLLCAAERELITQGDLVPTISDLPRALKQAHDQHGAGQTANMGATIAAAEIDRCSYSRIHWGDCRILHIRGQELIGETADHTKARRLREEYGWNEHEIPPAANAVIGKCVILREGELDPELLGQPEHQDAVPLEEGDWLVLCSDGLTRVFNNGPGESGSQEIARLMAACSTPEEAVQCLRRYVNLLVRFTAAAAGSDRELKAIDDNITIIAYRHRTTA
jgi:serine/threonine protein phosphatase PrpC